MASIDDMSNHICEDTYTIYLQACRGFGFFFSGHDSLADTGSCFISKPASSRMHTATTVRQIYTFIYLFHIYTLSHLLVYLDKQTISRMRIILINLLYWFFFSFFFHNAFYCLICLLSRYFMVQFITNIFSFNYFNLFS